MRLLVVTHNYPRFPGDPAGVYVRRLAEAARDVGHEVLVLAPMVSFEVDENEARIAAGPTHYAVRVLPRHADLGNPFEPGLIVGG